MFLLGSASGAKCARALARSLFRQATTVQLQKDSPIPLYRQLLNEIRERIASGEWPVGTRLPTEDELVAQLDVSRVTVRQALQAAVAEGLLVRVPAKGTYVAETKRPLRSRGFVGYVIPHLSHSFNVQSVLGAESVLKEEGYQLIFCNSEADAHKEDHLLERLELDGTVGYIIHPLHAERKDRAIYRLVAEGKPVVLVDRYLPDLPTDTVMSDHFSGGYAVVRHLIEQGYTDILYLARHPLELSSIAERWRGYQAAMAEAGLTPRPPLLVGGPVELGYIQSQRAFTLQENATIQAIAEFLCGPERPQAIVAMNDIYALLTLEAARQVGLRIPEDFALVGFDDLDFAEHFNLTTVAQQPFAMGVEAARLLLARMRGERSVVGQVRLPTQLIVRSSSLNPRLKDVLTSVP